MFKFPPKISTFIMMLVGLVPGLYFFAFNVIGFNFDFFPGDLGDGRLNLYFLEHAHKLFTGKLESFWNVAYMYPEPNVTAYTETLLGTAPIYSFFRLLGFAQYTSYQCWYILVAALNYAAAFYLLKYLFKNNYAAILGAFVFAFSIALQSQLTHAQTFPRFAIPLAFLMAVKYSEELRPKYLFLTMLMVVYQLYCGIYIGFMLAVPVGIYLGLILVRARFYEKRFRFNLKWFKQLGIIGGVNALILMPLMLPYMERKISPTLNHFRQITPSIPTLKSYIYSQEGSLFWDFLSKPDQNLPAWWDHQIFTGAIASFCFLIVTFWLITAMFNKSIKFKTLNTPLLLFLTAIPTLFLYFRFKWFSLYITIYFLPGFSAMRSMTRIINIELVFFALACAFVASKLFNKKPKYQFVLFAVAFALLICDNYFYANKSYKTKVVIAENRIKRMDSTYARLPAGALVSFEPLNPESSITNYQIDAMFLAQKYNLKTLNAYTASCPGDYVKYWQNPNEISRNYWVVNRDINLDTIYVVKGKNLIQKVLIDSIKSIDQSAVIEQRIRDLIEYIKTDSKWFENVIKNAEKRNISVDSMLLLDARWVIENERK